MHHFYLTEIDFLTICRAIGLIGFILYATGFFCLSVGRLDSSRPLYFGLVFAASCWVMISLWADFNLSAALIQGFYILMSAGGILRRRHRIVGTA
jgi:hypothetical protein